LLALSKYQGYLLLAAKTLKIQVTSTIHRGNT
jgi:hypothetical protein